MSAAVAILPTEAAVQAAWDRYLALANEWVANDEAKLNHEFNMKLARAWDAWREAFLEWAKRC